MNFTQNKFLTDKELKLLKWNLGQETNLVHVLMVELAMFTGARSAEVLETVKEDLANGCIVIHGKKNSKDRTVPLPANFLNKLVNYVKGLEDGAKIFPVSTRQFRKIWKKLTPNKDKSLHCLRHTMGVRLYNNCEDLHAVQTMLGHVSVQNTMVYLDFVEGNKKLKTSIQGMWSNKLDHNS